MYKAHFGLREPPFRLTPDTSFFFACENYQEALNTLLIAAQNGEGFIKIIGEVGNGKTLLCRKFLATLREDAAKTPPKMNFVFAYLPNPYLEPRSLLLALAEDFRLALAPNADQHEILKGLTKALLNFAREGKQVLVCLDEAQAIPLETLEVLRLLTNLETEKRKLMQVVLFGQPELDERLKQNAVRQLRQRITFQYQLKSLKREEVARYLRHRLAVACYAGPQDIFTRPAVGAMRRVTGGTPRLINIVANKAMLLAYGEGQHQVTARHVRWAAKDTPEARRDWQPSLLGGLLALLMLAGASIGWMMAQ
ncbi:MAG: AAA family ATPase [Azonexus sp.]|jgi:MSHA biogenesis protein MshM|nr:AAA family ATPase [Azonexus sp.]